MTDATALNDALSGNYLLVDLELRSWSGQRTDRGASDEIIHSKGATKDAGRFVKYLLASADTELTAVHKAGAAIRAFVYSRTLPWSGNTDGARRGPRLLAAKESFDFLKELNVLKQQYDSAILTLQSVWDARVTQAMGNLAGLASAEDYPSADQLPEKFGVSVDISPVPSVGDFRRINIPSELAEALGQRAAAQSISQANNALDDLKERILKELERIATQLGKAGAGEKTRLYDSLVTNMQALVGLARAMNVGGNTALNELADKIEATLLQRPVEVYRNHPEQAAQAAQAAQQLAVDAAMEDIWKVG